MVETICDLLEEMAADKPPGVTNYRDLITFVKDRLDMMPAMQLMHQRLSVSSSGYQMRPLKLVYIRRCNGIWTIVSGGREYYQVLID